MKEQLITLETAKLAKELGFDLKLTTYYHPSYGLCTETPFNEYRDYNSSIWAKGYYSAPTQSLLQKWLREKHDIFVSINVEHIDNEPIFRVQSIFEYKTQVVLNQSICAKMFDTYEEALERGLQAALNQLK